MRLIFKLDVEGAEVNALEGASETLASQRPASTIEAHGLDKKEEGCLRILRRFGYQISIVNQGKFLKDRVRRGHNRWLAAYPS